MQTTLQRAIATILIALILSLTGFSSHAVSAAAPGPAAVQSPTYVYYVVRPGDQLTDIAPRYCTSWQEIYALNRATIGPDPNHLVPGMTLIIPVRCGGPGGCQYVYDRGWLPHASGYVIPPNQYWVEKGDTWYSIGKRFGVSIQSLRQTNGLNYPYAFSVVRIPCLNQGYPLPPPPMYPTPLPMPSPTPAPTPTPTPPVQSAISIDSPLPNAVLPMSFPVQGRGQGLPEGNVVVRVKDGNGVILAEKATILQGANVGVGGEGTWTLNITISVPTTNVGVIEAFTPNTNAFTSIPIFFQQKDTIDYAQGECWVQVNTGTKAYIYPEGDYLGNFTGAAAWQANRRELVNGVFWYRLPIQVETHSAIWVKSTEVTGVSEGCF